MLLFFNEPFKDESLSSLLYRTAQKNRMDNLNWILSNFSDFSGIHLIQNKINWITDSSLEKMAEFLLIPVHLARELTFISTLERNNIKVKSIEKNPWFLYSRTKCCPLCIREAPYHRKIWSSNHSVICTKHRVFLIDRCPSCNKPLNIQSIINNKCCKCKISIYSYIPQIIKSSSFLFQYQTNIDNVLNTCGFKYKHKWINSNSIFIKAIEFIGNWIVRFLKREELNFEEYSLVYDGNARERNSLKNPKSIEQTICIYSYSFKVLNEWPLSFYRLLELSETNKKKDYSNFIHTVVPSLYGTELSFISNAFNDYIAHEKLALNKKQNFIRTDQIKLVNGKFNASIKDHHVFDTFKYNYLDKEITLVRYEVLETFLNDFKDSYTKEELKNRWGTSSKSTQCILENGMLSKAFKYHFGSTTSWIITKESVEQFENALISKSKSFSSISLTLKQAIEWGGPNNTHFILNGILSGKIKFHFNKINFSKSLVSKGDVYKYLSEILIQQGESNMFISTRNLVFLLGVKKSDIHYWVKTGRFGSIIEVKDDAISTFNVKLFLEQYRTTLQVSIASKKTVKQVLKKHSQGHINSVSGPALKDGNRLLFMRQHSII